MPVNYAFKRGVDLPSWQWLAPFLAGVSYTGTSCSYDGSRYIYWGIQYVVPAGPGACSLWRYDTWTNGWQLLAAMASLGAGLEVIYDPVRNVVYCTNLTTAWACFNLNTTTVTIANTSCPAWAYTTMTPVLPATILAAASFALPTELEVTAPISSLIAGTGSTTTSIVASTNTFTPAMVGQAIRFTSGALSGARRTITAWTSATTVTVNAFSGSAAAADTFVLEMEEGTATSATTTTVTDTAKAWTVNQYANLDVLIVSGTGSGQRRRIASNTATVLTCTAAVTGNARTGVFSPTPDATSVYRIVPSSDFLYYFPGTGVSFFYRLDLVQTTGAAWSAALATPPAIFGSGGNMFFAPEAPYALTVFRANIGTVLYHYNIGLNTWTTPTVFVGPTETFTTGASSTYIKQYRKIFVNKEGSQRCYFYDLMTGILEPAGFAPYATSGAVDGKRACYVKTPDGVMWVYLMRASGQELFRMPLEWPI